VQEKIIVRVFRYNPATDAEPRFDEFTLPYSHGATVLGALRYIHENLDATLAFRNYHCGALICGCCQVTVNGKRTKSCGAVIGPGETVMIEPFDRNRVIRDLAIKFE
jgi:fumarate reductase iron-sulfur subunit